MRLRKRDIVASILFLLLSHQLYYNNYDHGSESLVVTIDLGFYTNFKSHVVLRTSKGSESLVTHLSIADPVPFDIDGDGIIETIVVPSLENYDDDHEGDNISTSNDNDQNNVHEWILNVMDLKVLQSKNNRDHMPLYPDIMLQSKGMKRKHKNTIQSQIVPIKITTGQIIMNSNNSKIVKRQRGNEYDNQLDDNKINQYNEKRHYFCGIDWDDAMTSCSYPCPNGTHDSCPNGQKCFERTPCDILGLKRGEMDTIRNITEIALTPNGGLPSIATVWSNGDVTLHSITANIHTANIDKKVELEMRELWRVNPFIISNIEKQVGVDDNGYFVEFIDFDEIDIVLDSDLSIGTYGAAVVIASSCYKNDHSSELINSYFSIDAFNGDILWVQSNERYNNQNITSLGIEQIESVSLGKTEHDHSTWMGETIDCLDNFKHSILNPSTKALPHYVHDSSISKLVLTYFYSQQSLLSSIGSKQKRTSDGIYKSNVALYHYHKGIDVLSLQNGNNICHLPLHSDHVYADLNSDGFMDKIQMPIVNTTIRLEDSKTYNELDGFDYFCHVIVTTNILTGDKRTLIDLCSSLIKNTQQNKRKIAYVTRDDFKKVGTKVAAPLLVEGFDEHSRPVKDIVFALNHGSVQRYDMHGNIKWRTNNKPHKVPTWSNENNGFLGRIDFKRSSKEAALEVRPILIVGENELSVLSSEAGRVLASMTFPQLAVAKPTLDDFDGDGTTDVMLITKDAVWVYLIKVQGHSYMIRIAMLVLIIGFVIALTIHELGPDRDGRRATDVD